MPQILSFAPSMRPDMLPVVSRQKTTSTAGFLGEGTGAAVNGSSKANSATTIQEAHDARRESRDMGGKLLVQARPSAPRRRMLLSVNEGRTRFNKKGGLRGCAEAKR